MVRQILQRFQRRTYFSTRIKEPQEGLVPLFNSPFYATPDTPADPTDCNRYPNSPYCGGNPLAINFAPSVELSLVNDKCNVGIQFDGSFGFIKFPPVQIVYRNPNCQLPPPPSPPTGAYSEFADIPKSLYDSDLWLIIPKFSYYEYARIYSNPNTYESETRNFVLGDIEGEIGVSPIKVTVYVNYKYVRRGLSIKLSRNDPNSEPYADSWRRQGGSIAGDINDDDSLWQLEIQWAVDSFWNGAGSTYYVASNNGYFQGADGLYPVPNGGQIRFIGARYEEFIIDPLRPRNFRQIGYSDPDAVYTLQESRLRIKPLHEKEPPPFLPPPPPPPPPMSCCPNVEQNDQLLKLILKKIGATHLPASVPKVLTDQKKGNIKIESLAEFTAYTIKQLDALCGKYPIEIEIEDSDLTTEGNQTKKIKLPNLAETLAEIMGLLLVIRSESDATLNATIRGLTEAGSAKQMAFMAYEYAKANAEFLGYKGEQKERKVPFAFKPGETRLDKMLQEGEMSVKGWENEDKDDFNDHIAPLLELAAMWKVANYRKTGAGDPADDLKTFLKNASRFSEVIDAAMLLEKMNKEKEQEKPDLNQFKSDWDKFADEVERGFITQPGIKDKEHPYGKPLEERPRIRDISVDTSEKS